MNLPDGLLAQVRERAAQSGRTTTSLVEEALRLLLATPAEQPTADPLPAFGSPTAGFLVDLDDREALWAALDEPA